MVNSAQVPVCGRNRRMLEFISGSGDSSLPVADVLLKMNLPPLIGRRDAAFDIAEKLICSGDFSFCTAEDRFSAYRQLSRLLRESCLISHQIVLMLNSPDTRSREQRLLAHCVLLDTLGAALANFFELRDMMLSNTYRDAMSVMEEEEAQQVISALNDVEHDMLKRLRRSFNRSHWRVVRYRTYAWKSFSPENAERYKRAYTGCVNKHRNLLDNFSVSLPVEFQF